MGLGCTKDSLASVILGLSGGTPAGRYPVPAPGKGQGGEGKSGWAGPAHRAGPAGRLTLEADPGPSRRMTPGERARPYA
jgi:hypothetical protein